jgi:hypothetical protein
MPLLNWRTTTERDNYAIMGETLKRIDRSYWLCGDFPLNSEWYSRSAIEWDIPLGKSL